MISSTEGIKRGQAGQQHGMQRLSASICAFEYNITYSSGPLSLARRVSHMTLRKHAHAMYINLFGCKKSQISFVIFDSFLIFAQNIDCGYTLEPPRGGGSNEYPQSMV